jgi:hypothetical protein
MNKNYKAIPYTMKIHHDSVTDEEEPWNNVPEYDTVETRFCIVSVETGEILDDAQGYGYKSAQKAYAAYGYKTRDRSKDKTKQQKNKRIREWMKEHKSFVKAMDEIAFEIAKGSWGPEDKFNAKQVENMLKEFGLETDFTAYELLKVWEKS